MISTAESGLLSVSLVYPINLVHFCVHSWLNTKMPIKLVPDSVNMISCPVWRKRCHDFYSSQNWQSRFKFGSFGWIQWGYPNPKPTNFTLTFLLEKFYFFFHEVSYRNTTEIKKYWRSNVANDNIHCNKCSHQKANDTVWKKTKIILIITD